MLHLTIKDKCDVLGQSAIALREAPQQLQEEIAHLKAQLQEVRDAEVERMRLEAMMDPDETERIAREKLEQAHADNEGKESELRRMRIALQTARDELQKVSASKADLKRALDAERAELHKLRQQSFITQLPERIVSDVPAHGSPRQREHPELTSPRQDARQEQRAQSASRSRTVAQQQRQRPFSARPVLHERYLEFGHTPYSPRDPVAAAAAAATAVAPSLSLRIPSPHHAATGGSASARSAASSGSGSAGTRRPIAAPQSWLRPQQQEAAADAATQTGGGELERQVRDLQRANAQLQTALLAQALDPDGVSSKEQLGGLLAAVDSNLMMAGHAAKVRRPRQLVQARAPGSGDRAWPFPPGKGVPASQLPRGFATFPPQA